MMIVNLKDKRFGSKSLYRVMDKKHYGFYVEGKGYIAFASDRDKLGVLTPYTPSGGKKALQSILDAGGFLSFEGMEYVNAI